MKKIFIDGGARVGESIEYLLEKRNDLLGCEVYFFECNPIHINTLNKIKDENKNYNFHVSDCALWINDGEMPLYVSVDRWGDLGCTLHKEKREKLDTENPIVVKTIRLSDFLDNFSNQDYIVLKLDIEGSEYEVINDLINTDKIKKINELHVEWHDHFFLEKTSYFLKEKLKKYNIFVNNNWV